MGTIHVRNMTLERETKNKLRYNDFSEFGAIYIPKEKFNGSIPQEINLEIHW